MNGIFAVRKPNGPTSQEVVAKLKHIFTKSPEYKNEVKNVSKFNRRKQKFIKIGHGGTLDPLAEGTLVIGVGTGTKQLANYLGQCSKIYTATAMLGASTTTYDSQGSVLEYGTIDPKTVSGEQIEEAISKFRGKITQLPPVFSALKMDGKPLYEYAREGKTLPRPIEPRECEISLLTADKLDTGTIAELPTNMASASERKFAEGVLGHELAPIPEGEHRNAALLKLRFSVSSGTYIRTLIHDIGEALGTKAHMTKLTRESQGEWELGKNVLPLSMFDEPFDKWWPVLKTVLSEGPQLRVEEATAEYKPKNEENKGIPDKSSEESAN